MFRPIKPSIPKEVFWITNSSRQAVSLGDLGICVRPQSSVNLLDEKHYSITKEQIYNSITSGSISRASKKIIIRKSPPSEIQDKNQIQLKEDALFQFKKRSGVETKNIVYEELNISDEEYASQNADFSEFDNLDKWNKNKG